jgi:hypothetical protein
MGIVKDYQKLMLLQFGHNATQLYHYKNKG